MGKERRLIILVIVLAVCLVGCGVSKSDYKELEERVSKLEKQVNGEDSQKDTEPEGKKNTPGVSGKNENCFDLSKMTTDEIVEIIVRLLRPEVENKTPEEVFAALAFPVEPNLNGASYAFIKNGEQDFFFEKGDGDRFTNLRYSYGKNMDGTLNTISGTWMAFTICGYNRAEELFDKIVAKVYPQSPDKNKPDFKSGTRWKVYDRDEWGNALGGMEMNGYNDIYTFNINMPFYVYPNSER